MKFVSGIKCCNQKERGYWFIFSKNKMLYQKNGDTITVPQLLSPAELGLKTTPPIYLGQADGVSCFTAELICADNNIAECCTSPEPSDFKNLRELYPLLGDEIFALAGRALQIDNWSNSWQFCPTCGSPLENSTVERAKICTSCSIPYYPVISPAIIVAVTKGDKILLARNLRNKGFKRFSILAGFVEPGESLEETVAREVEEEVSIKVKNIKYFGSQSWPFPHSLMLGFTAEHESGEIKVDGVEIGEAAWFSADNLPEIPPYGSISRVLIDDFVKNNS
ncbi:MAG: NAD(+) diphosphatase [Spirochaetia bacterium]|nr:NAD(+) diphosphatase [Spirochaetia bacterium]